MADQSAEAGNANDSSDAPSSADVTGPIDQTVADVIGFDIDVLAKQTDWSKYEDQLAQWRQGHLLTDVPVTWLAAPGLDPITGVDQSASSMAPLFDPTGLPAIVCTQTCDLGATPPGDRHPFVHVAPLIRGDELDRNRRKLASQGKVSDLVAVRVPVPAPLPSGEGASREAGPPALGKAPAPSEWFADLRLQMPISKAVLLDRQPIEGFEDEDGYTRFAELLAYKARRPALHAALSEDVPRMLTKFVRDIGAAKQCFAKVEQVRLLVLEGAPLYPARASFYVLTNGVKLDDDEREVWNQFQAQVSKPLKDNGIELAPLVHADVGQLSAVAYRSAVPVPCDALGALRYW